MKKQNRIDRLSGWEWITLVAAWRYYEHGQYSPYVPEEYIVKQKGEAK